MPKKSIRPIYHWFQDIPKIRYISVTSTDLNDSPPFDRSTINEYAKDY